MGTPRMHTHTPHLLGSNSEASQANALNSLSPQQAVVLPSGVGHDVLEARHETIVVLDKQLLRHICHCSSGGDNLLQHQFCTLLQQLEWKVNKITRGSEEFTYCTERTLL